MAGVGTPLDLPSMHHLLDVAEMLTIESMSSSNEIQRYYWRTYKPDPAELSASGFTAQDQADSFYAFSAALGNMH